MLILPFQFKWADPDEEGLKQFLVEEKGFNEKRVSDAIEKLKKSKTSTVQARLTSYFGPVVVKRKVCGGEERKRKTNYDIKREEEKDKNGKKLKADAKGKGKGKTATPTKKTPTKRAVPSK